MPSGNFGAAVRLVALVLIAVAFWLLGRYATGMPDPKPLTAPATEFSAARADATLAMLLGPEIPHPIGSAENANVRARILGAFAKLGVPARVYAAQGCMGREKYGYVVCGLTRNVIAQVAPGEGKAIILLAHYDSVPAGPGASDDESGVATVLETVRALKAGNMQTKHPIIALITDGEEAGLLGAAAFAHDPALRAQVGMIVNVEARGNQGPSLLFQTSPGDSKLIDLYARSVPDFETSSLFSVIYKALPNDTDLTVFLDKGLTGFNFAFSGNVAHYHTTLDRRENLSLSTLQQHGNNMLGVTRALMQTDFESLKGGDDVYLTIYGKWLPRLPAGLALPLALLAFVLVAVTAFLSRTGANGVGRWAAALAMPPAVLIGCAAIGWVLFNVAALVSGQPDPTYAYPVYLRFSLLFGVVAVVVLCARMASPRLAALSVWFWLSGLGVVTAATLPGLSPYFFFPALIASVLLLIQSRTGIAWSGFAGEVAILLAAVPVLVIWMALTATGETVQGLALHPLFTIPAAFGVMALIPLVTVAGRSWTMAWGGAAALAFVVAIVAGTQPAFSAITPQRLNITLVDNHIDNKALWVAETGSPLPPSVQAAAKWSDTKVKAYPLAFGLDWVAPAGPPRFAPPSATVETRPKGKGRKVLLTLIGSPASQQMMVIVPNGSGLTAATLGDQTFKVTDNATPRGTVIACAGACREQMIALDFNTTKPVDVTIGEQRFGLPADGQTIAAKRPKEAVPSQTGDAVIVMRKLTLR
jgi:hypothetical protein